MSFSTLNLMMVLPSDWLWNYLLCARTAGGAQARVGLWLPPAGCTSRRGTPPTHSLILISHWGHLSNRRVALPSLFSLNIARNLFWFLQLLLV